MQTFAVCVDCVACKGSSLIYVEPADYIRWSLNGVHAQDAFPYLTDDEREALITNMCLDCIDEMYSDMEEEEDDWEEPDEGAYLRSDEEINEIPVGPLDPFSDFPEYERDWYVD